MKIFEQLIDGDGCVFTEMYINSEHFPPGTKLRITVEKVEG